MVGPIPFVSPERPISCTTRRCALYQFLHELELSDVVFVGHSDGASISLIFTGEHQWASGLVLIAPHVFVEPETIAGIEQTVRRFETTDLPQRLAKYHRDPEEIFKAWSEIWLDPAFRDWNIEDSLPNIQCPVLLIQALDDEYGTMAQLDAIERGVIGPWRGWCSRRAATRHTSPIPTRCRKQSSGL